jgi:hypothetical protein
VDVQESRLRRMIDVARSSPAAAGYSRDNRRPPPG